MLSICEEIIKTIAELFSEIYYPPNSVTRKKNKSQVQQMHHTLRPPHHIQTLPNPHTNAPALPYTPKIHTRTTSRTYTYTYARPPHTLPGLRIRLREMGHSRLTAIFARPGSLAGGSLISRSKIRESSAKEGGKRRRRKGESSVQRKKMKKKKLALREGKQMWRYM